MPTRRMSKVWAPGYGWLKKETEAAATYENLGDGWPLLIAIMRWFPDFTADLFRSENADFELTFTQRLFLRANANYKDVATTACRGAGKSYCLDIGQMVDGLVWPGEETAILAPTQKQGVEIEAKIYKQVENNYPALTSLYTVVANSTSSGRFIINTELGSEISIGSFRGNTVHKALAEETAQEELGIRITPVPDDGADLLYALRGTEE